MLRITTSAATLLAAGALVAGCGSSSSDPPSGASTSGSTSKGSPIAFAQCMRANGVSNFPDPSSGAGGGLRIQTSRVVGSGPSTKVNGVSVNAPGFKSAMQKCHHYLPNGGVPDQQQLAKLKAGALAMAKCMRAHGVTNFPDPVVSTGPGGQGMGIRVGGPNVDFNSPAFKAASKICGSLIGAGPGGGFAAKGP